MEIQPVKTDLQDFLYVTRHFPINVKLTKLVICPIKKHGKKLVTQM